MLDSVNEKRLNTTCLNDKASESVQGTSSKIPLDDNQFYRDFNHGNNRARC